MPKSIKKRRDFKSEKAWQEYMDEKKQKIIESFGKGRTIDGQMDYIGNADGVQPIYGPLSEPEVPPKYLLTNTLLDEVLSYLGGLEPGSSLELYGEYAVGKTRICQVLAAEAEGLVIYVDSEHTLRRKGLLEIIEARGGDADDVNSRLLVYRPDDWMDQYYVSMNLPEYDGDGEFVKVGLVVIDSISKLWREAAEFFGRQNLTNRQQLFRAHVKNFKDYAERHGAVLVYTNQIYRKPDASIMYPAPEQVFIAAMGDTIAHLADYRVLLLKKRGAIRVARLVDALDIPLQEVPFMLTDKGVEDIPDPAERAKALEKSAKYGEKFESGQVTSQKAAKKYEKAAEELGLVDEDEEMEVEIEEGEVLSQGTS